MANLKKITILFLLIVLSSFVYSATENTAFGKFVNNGEYTITKTGNEANYDVSLETKEVDISSTWIKILSFLKLDERDYEEQIAVQICTGNLTNKEFKFKEASNGFDVINKKTKETEYFIYNELPKKDISGKVLKTISKELKENIKDSIKTGERYCYYDMIPKNITYVKYGDNSIVITPNYDFSTDILEDDTRAEPNNVHLNISDTSPYDSLVGYWSFDGDAETDDKGLISDGGDDYIDTGVSDNPNLTMEVKGRLITQGDVVLIGLRDTNPLGDFYIGEEGSEWRYGFGSDSASDLVTSDNDVHIWKLDKDGYGYLDGVQIVDKSGSSRVQTTAVSIYLYARNLDSSTSKHSKTEIHYAKIWDNDELIRNFQQKENGCFNETVNNVEYCNDGSGDLGYGNSPTTAYDLTRQDNDGSYEGSAYAGTGKYDDGLVLD